MRNGQNKRMRGRNNNHHHHRKNQNPLTRVYESNGPDVKIRGTASHVAEKYMQLARDATSSGDPVTAENYFQHAEHYLRLIAAAQEQFRQQNPYYRPENEVRDDNSDDNFDYTDDATQPSMQGQPNFGNNPYPPRDGQPPYPPREPQPYGGQNQPNHQGRPQHQQHNPQHSQQHNQPHQQHHNQQPHHQQPHQQHQQPNQQPPQHQPNGNEGNDVERLPSFITGGQPQQNFNQNGYDNNQGGDRYGRHRRRRHRGSHQRPDIQGGQGGNDPPDNQRPDGE